ncbi:MULTISPECIES: GH92 family glycosyl hydrolase [Paraburkholderia]|uniref:GH92 family glycosyl hydrolase n=1 Tax=Paraburkholderia TaxID=1822464 RepID=UPI00224F9F57|nr:MULTISPECIES: GH92 family glycosyl hydrolase [Paraburkholderia]MCX4163074.1 GH92 family glycosyl hydrolase [Paraburkholderia megapolitana]MDN7158570.1 GH92 family glycosyl hydrolase [Paraburkholderia sp. CHISQ3]MDQ6495617.1 GH92 family glycosyl hydrolase [Paraburkholderia megapolitana]
MKNLLRLAAVMASMATLAGCGGDIGSTQTAAHPGTPTNNPVASGAGSGSGTPSAGTPSAGTPGAQPAPATNTPAAVTRTDIAGLTKFVNVFIGTDTPDTGLYGYPGNLNPAAETPFGMVSFGPDTPGSQSPYGEGSGGYFYGDSSIDFFSLTHLQGPGCRGQGAVAMIPGGGPLTFSHTDESALPGYYKVKTGNGIVNELTATTRTGMARLTFPASMSPSLVVNALISNGMKSGVSPKLVNIAVDAQTGVVSGQTVVGAFCGGTWYKPVYFYMLFDTAINPKTTKVANGVANIGFAQGAAGSPTVVQLKVGISSVSVANAKLNLTTENPNWSFDTVQQNQQAIWNHRLNTVQLDLAAPGAMDGLSSAQLQTANNYVTQFYTALYHTLTGPTVYSDVNGDYRSMQQANLSAPGNTAPSRPTANVSQYAVPGNAAAYKTHYSGFSLWDTYRSETQLQALLFPSEVSDMMQSLVADASQCGAFPHWVDGSDDTTPMEGDHAPNAIAGAYVFGARSFDTATARKYMLQSAFGKTPGGTYTVGACNDKSSVVPAAGSFYLKNGYVATDIVPNNHSGSMTLEFMTTDESIGNFLAALGNTQDASNVTALHKRAGNWANIFDANIPASQNYFGGVTAALVPKNSSGQWVFNDPNNGGFHESTEPNYLWTVRHDYTALNAKLGGNATAIAQLNALFGLDATNPYGGALPSGSTLNSGEGGSTLYIGNEPSLQTPWAYNWTGTPQLAQRVIPIVLKQTFNNDPGGLPGNDDLGATSGFYLWASLGLYPVIPSAPGLAMSTPQFKGMTVWLGDGTKKLRIEADDEALLNNKPYIKSVQLNGKTWTGSWLPLADIANGGTLTYTLSATPTDWASGTALLPPSGPAADYTQPLATPAP